MSLSGIVGEKAPTTLVNKLVDVKAATVVLSFTAENDVKKLRLSAVVGRERLMALLIVVVIDVLTGRLRDVVDEDVEMGRLNAAVDKDANIDPAEPLNMSILLAFELTQWYRQSWRLNDVACQNM